MGKYAAYLVCAASVVLPSVTNRVHAHGAVPRHGDRLRSAAPESGVLALGLAAYGAVFLLAGVGLKRPLVAGLVFAFGWEQIALVMPGYLKHFTIAYYLQALLPQATPPENTLSLLETTARGPTVDGRESCSGFPSLFVTALILSMRTVERREYVLEQ
jgi:hypothetical protein